MKKPAGKLTFRNGDFPMNYESFGYIPACFGKNIFWWINL